MLLVQGLIYRLLMVELTNTLSVQSDQETKTVVSYSTRRVLSLYYCHFCFCNSYIFTINLFLLTLLLSCALNTEHDYMYMYMYLEVFVSILYICIN